MSKLGELTDVGKFIQNTLVENSKMKNREVAQLVINHFPDQEFETLALRQRIANFKYLNRRPTTQRIITKN